MAKRYDINKFYVGELYLSYEFTNLLMFEQMTPEEETKRREIISLMQSGVIDFEGSWGTNIDCEKKRSYRGVLAIFYDTGNYFICFHNGKKYSRIGNDYCKNLVSLPKLLPKLDFYYPSEISVDEAVSLYNALVRGKKYLINNLFEQRLHSIEEFYVGNLNLYCGFKTHNEENAKYQHASLPERYILTKNGAKSTSMFGINNNYRDEYGSVYDAHDYISYRCLFLQHQGEAYDVHNYQMYEKGTFERENLSCKEFIGESYFDFMTPFKDYLEKENRLPKKDMMSLKKALKIYRK